MLWKSNIYRAYYVPVAVLLFVYIIIWQLFESCVCLFGFSWEDLGCRTPKFRVRHEGGEPGCWPARAQCRVRADWEECVHGRPLLVGGTDGTDGGTWDGLMNMGLMAEHGMDWWTWDWWRNMGWTDSCDVWLNMEYNYSQDSTADWTWTELILIPTTAGRTWYRLNQDIGGTWFCPFIPNTFD
jgi:hypothetical protein